VGSSHQFAGADQGDVAVSVFLLSALPGRGPGPHRHPYVSDPNLWSSSMYISAPASFRRTCLSMDGANVRESKRAGVILGIGLGGFVDGILFHQIIHWHSMGSAVLPPTTLEAMQQNMVWDGIFHAAVWLATLVGVYWLLNDGRRGKLLPSPRIFTGLMVLGWGVFNLVEGIIDHHLLGLHHVRDLPTHVPFYDWLFIAIGGVGFILLGSVMSRR
jgi:uncharacterized membrane protein